MVEKINWSNENVEKYIKSLPEDFRFSIIISTLTMRNQLDSTKNTLNKIIKEAPGEGIDIISPASLALTESDQESLIKAVSLIDTVILRLSSQYEIGVNTFKKV